MNVNELLKELGEKIGIGALELNTEGGCALTLDEKIDLTFEYNEERDELIMHSVIGSIEETTNEERELIYVSLLSANLFGKGTGGAVAALDPHSGGLYLFKAITCSSVTFEALWETFERFIDFVTRWHELFESGSFEAVAELSEEESAIEKEASEPADYAGRFVKV